MPKRAASLFPARAILLLTVIDASAVESSRPVLLEQDSSSTPCLGNPTGPLGWQCLAPRTIH